ncbi:MAG: DUF3853 family protein [Bacteroidaceae bacterium]|nr:DUF3853 family protein [Bacteroidaceae bacterium]
MKVKNLNELTSDELKQLLREAFGDAITGNDTSNQSSGKVEVHKHYVYGLDGLAKALGVSKSTAARIKKSGVIDAAISQVNRIICTDIDLAMELLRITKRR